MSKLDELRQAQARKDERNAEVAALAVRIRDGFTAHLEERDSVKLVAPPQGLEGGRGVFVLGVKLGAGKILQLGVYVEDAGEFFDISFSTLEEGAQHALPIRVQPDSTRGLNALFDAMFSYLKTRS